MISHLSRNSKDHLLIEDIDTIELSKRFGTPLYVVCEERVRNNYKNFKELFTKYYNKNIVAYSYKTNFLPTICAILKNEGAWSEVVSALELSIAQKIQVNPTKIIFNGPCKTDEGLLEAIRLGVSVINIDSLGELKRIRNLVHKTGLTANIGVRLHNPFEKGKIPSRFGLDIKKAFTACKMICNDQKMNYRGIHIHLGTQITNIKSYIMIIKYAINFISKLQSKLGLNTFFLNIGGGFPSNQKPLYAIEDPWPTPSLEEYASKICSTLKANHNKINYPYLVLEPGRAIVSSSTYLITKIMAIKSIDKAGKWIILDAGLNLIPEAEYFYYNTIPSNRHTGERENIHIGGPLCMHEDIIGLNRRLPKLQEGDILVIPNVGAYNISLSWQFIKPRPNICMIHKNGVELIRKTEMIDDILRLDLIPKHLNTNYNTER